jgi:hypothetical protein
MRIITLILYSSTAFLWSVPGFGRAAKEGVKAYPVQYQGGSLPLRQNHVVNAVVANTEVIFVQHGQRFAVPIKDINEISCATDVHRRFGASVLRLVPLVDLDKVQDHYVGVTWTDKTRRADKSVTMEVLFKLNPDEYRDFVAALERLTGKRAVNTNMTPTVVHYSL